MLAFLYIDFILFFFLIATLLAPSLRGVVAVHIDLHSEKFSRA